MLDFKTLIRRHQNQPYYNYCLDIILGNDHHLKNYINLLCKVLKFTKSYRFMEKEQGICFVQDKNAADTAGV